MLRRLQHLRRLFQLICPFLNLNLPDVGLLISNGDLGCGVAAISIGIPCLDDDQVGSRRRRRSADDACHRVQTQSGRQVLLLEQIRPIL